MMTPEKTHASSDLYAGRVVWSHINTVLIFVPVCFLELVGDQY